MRSTASTPPTPSHPNPPPMHCMHPSMHGALFVYGEHAVPCNLSSSCLPASTMPCKAKQCMTVKHAWMLACNLVHGGRDIDLQHAVVIL